MLKYSAPLIRQSAGMFGEMRDLAGHNIDSLWNIDAAGGEFLPLNKQILEHQIQVKQDRR